jgi:hypothetical protein
MIDQSANRVLGHPGAALRRSGRAKTAFARMQEGFSSWLELARQCASRTQLRRCEGARASVALARSLPYERVIVGEYRSRHALHVQSW